jgi:hypothetical protein
MRCAWNSSGALLAGTHTTYELAQIPGPGTAGQLYRYLRELRAAGLVVQRRRSDYAVPRAG